VKAGIYCRGCWYDLRGIESGKCPECGRDFDPEQPCSFLYFPGTRMPDEMWSVLYVQSVAILLFLVGVVISKVDKRIAGFDVDLLSLFPFCIAPIVQLAAMINALIAVPIYLPKVEGRKRMFLLLIGLTPWAIGGVGVLMFWLLS
jgi:hypothetical protein